MKDNAIQIITNSYPQLEGSKILKLLSAHPNRPILSTVLELALYQKITIPEAEQGLFHPLGVPLTDSQTLKEIDKRLVRLFALKAQHTGETANQNKARNLARHSQDSVSSPFDAEISALIRYRKECTHPWGGIKNSDDELRRAYRRHYAAIHRLFNKAVREGLHEAVAIVKRSLRLGYSSLIRDPGSS